MSSSQSDRRMTIRWQPAPDLPVCGLDCGHGVGFCRGALHDSAHDRSLAAFVDGFAWQHGGADAVAVVRYAPDRAPPGAAFAAWQREVERVLQGREPAGEFGPGWCWVPNA